MNIIEFANQLEKISLEDSSISDLDMSINKEVEKNFLTSRAKVVDQENEQIAGQMQAVEEANSIKQIYDGLNNEVGQIKEELVQKTMQKTQMLSHLDGVRKQISDFLLNETSKDEQPPFLPEQVPDQFTQDSNRAKELEQQKMQEKQKQEAEMAQQAQKAQAYQQQLESLQQQSVTQTPDGMQQPGGQMQQPVGQDPMGGQPSMSQDPMMGQADAQLTPQQKMGSDKSNRLKRILKNFR